MLSHISPTFTRQFLKATKLLLLNLIIFELPRSGHREDLKIWGWANTAISNFTQILIDLHNCALINDS